MQKAIFILSLLLIFSLKIFAQHIDNSSSNHQVALEYYRSGEYEKAADIFQQLYLTNKSNFYYRYYLNSLIKLKQYDIAIDLINDYKKNDKNNPGLAVDLGYVYSLKGDNEKSRAIYTNAIKKLRPEHSQIINLANAFMSKNLYDYAEKTYIEGGKKLKNQYAFHMEKGMLYYYMRDYKKMISEYLDMLAVNERYLQMVQNRLRQAVYNDIDNNLTEELKTELINRINKHPDITVYNELLIWIYIQDKDFESAFIQAKALDMRLGENGRRIIALARIASDNNDFNTAVEAYDYVISKGKHLEYYYAARNEMLEVMYKRIKLNIDTRTEDFIKMESAFIDALDEMGININTIDLLVNLAHLQAFYLGKTVEAQFLLEDAKSMHGLNYKKRAGIELELADIYLIDGKVWDATLAYAKIEEENKDNPLGYDAKFRKARLAYYIGNFQWAMAQLDVLKASTSKLIANDAANLALFIYENTGWDSTETAMEMYSRADFLHYRAKDSLSVLTLDSLISIFPDHAITDEALFLQGNIYEKHNKLNKAIADYEKIVNNFYYEILSDNAIYAMANIYENRLNDKPKAMELYKKIITDFPDSIYKMEARLRYRKLRGDKVSN